MKLEERLAGGIWGHLVGDAMGVPYEFKSREEIGEVVWGKKGTHKQPAGTWSDDGGLMLALLDSLLSVGFSLQDQGEKALRWRDGQDYKPGEMFDIGNTTSKALERFSAGVSAQWSGLEGARDEGNGSLMRILPIALFGYRMDKKEVAAWAMQASRLTHRGPRAPIVCALYCLLAQGLLAGKAVIVAMAEAKEEMESVVQGKQIAALKEILAYSERKGSGYVVDSFWSALEALEGAKDYRETIERAVQYGNDTDSTACLAGGLAGIRWGQSDIPSEWRQGMRGREIVEPLLARLLERTKSDQTDGKLAI